MGDSFRPLCLPLPYPPVWARALDRALRQFSGNPDYNVLSVTSCDLWGLKCAQSNAVAPPVTILKVVGKFQGKGQVVEDDDESGELP